MVSVVESLHQDHANLAKPLNAIERQIGALEAGGVPDYDIVQGALDYGLNDPLFGPSPEEHVAAPRKEVLDWAADAP